MAMFTGANAPDIESHDSRYAAVFKAGVLAGLRFLKTLSDGDPQGFGVSHRFHIAQAIARVERTGKLPDEEGA